MERAKVGGALLQRFCLPALFVLAVAPGLWAQLGSQGTFKGAVRDSSNAVVAGATVTVTNIATEVAQSVTTNEEGLYVLPNLLPGHYRLEASHAGFQTELRSDVELTASQTQEIDFTLNVGATTQTVTVTSLVPLVDTTSSTVSSLVNEQQVQNLPLNGRGYEQLIYLAPGVANAAAATPPARTNPLFGIGGARPQDSRIMVDGSEMAGSGSQLNSLPNTASAKMLGVDGIAEFNISTNSGDATVGKAEGGQVNLVTRSGTNNFHGSVYEFYRNNIFNARNPFATTIPFLNRNNYGAVLGGPIKKNKAFFFFNFEQYRDRETLTQQTSVPTLAVRGVGFGGVEQIPTPNATNPCAITTINPNTGIQTNPAGSGLPTTQQLNVAAVQASTALLNFYPAPNGAILLSNGCPNGAQQTVTEPIQSATDSFYLGRVDYQLTQKQTLFARYLIQTGWRISYVPDPLAQFPQYNPLRTQTFSFGHRYDFSSGWLNQFTASFNRGGYYILDVANVPTSTIPASLGLFPGYTGVTQVGAVTLTGTTFGEINANAASSEFHDVYRQVSEADDQLSKTFGKHFVQTGVQLQRILSFERQGFDWDGLLNFPSILSMAQGVPNLLTTAVPGSDSNRTYKQTYFGAYIQDSYRLTSRLTVNVGLRGELLTNPTEGYGNLTQWYPVSGGGGACPGAVCYPSFPNPFPTSLNEPGLVYPAGHAFAVNNSGNVAPRLGFAWDVFGSNRTSVRGGWGLYYNQLQNEWRAPLDAIPPTFLPTTVSNPQWPSPGAPLLGLPVGTIPAGTQLAPSTVQVNPSVPAMFQYNLTIQQQIASNTLVSVGYAGSEDYHQARTVNAQIPAPIVNAAGQLQIPSQTQLNPALSAAASEIIFDGTGSYNSLQATLEQRLSHGLQLKASFVWSQALTDAPDTIGNIAGTGLVSNGPYDRGLASFSVGKAFTLNGIYALPLGTHQKAEGALLNGWQFGWIYHQQSGLPFRVTDGAIQLFSANNASAGRPDMNPNFSGPVILGGHTAANPYFNAQAFTPAPNGVLGDATSAAELTGPGLSDVDVSLMKLFKLTERFGLQFRVDAFNLFNHPNWNLPGTSLFSSITSTNPTTGATGCKSTATLTCNVGSFAYNPAAGVPTATVTDPRELQFALKLNF